MMLTDELGKLFPSVIQLLSLFCLFFVQVYWVTALQGRKKYEGSNIALCVMDKLNNWFKEESAAAKKEKRDIQLYHKVSFVGTEIIIQLLSWCPDSQVGLLSSCQVTNTTSRRMVYQNQYG